MSSLFESIKENPIKPSKSKGVTFEEHLYYSKKIVQHLKELGLKGERFLELSCGNCVLSMYSEREMGGEVVAVDRWTELPTDKEAKGYLVKFKSDVAMVEAHEALPFRDSTFDVVYALLVFYTMKRELRAKVLEEVRRVLRRGGVFVLADAYTMRGVRREVGMEEIAFFQDQGVYVSTFRKP
ncbi:MAG: class I SAM-dependent methyltransferase [Thermoprotei archaeon]